MRDLPEDILSIARKFGEDIRFDIASISRLSAASLWAQTGVIDRMNRGVARAIMAEQEACIERYRNAPGSDPRYIEFIRSPAIPPAGDRAVGGGSSLPPTANGEG